MPQSAAAGTFTFPDTDLTVARMGYGAMRLPGPHVWGPPRDRDAALAVLREAIALGINHIDTAEFYGPHVANVAAGALALPADAIARLDGIEGEG